MSNIIQKAQHDSRVTDPHCAECDRLAFCIDCLCCVWHCECSDEHHRDRLVGVEAMEKAFEELTAAVAGGVPMCGCGRPVRYIVSNGDGTADSCNKYMRCPTWDELYEQNKELRGKLGQYETLLKLFKDLSA